MEKRQFQTASYFTFVMTTWMFMQVATAQVTGFVSVKPGQPFLFAEETPDSERLKVHEGQIGSVSSDRLKFTDTEGRTFKTPTTETNSLLPSRTKPVVALANEIPDGTFAIEKVDAFGKPTDNRAQVETLRIKKVVAGWKMPGAGLYTVDRSFYSLSDGRVVSELNQTISVHTDGDLDAILRAQKLNLSFKSEARQNIRIEVDSNLIPQLITAKDPELRRLAIHQLAEPSKSGVNTDDSLRLLKAAANDSSVPQTQEEAQRAWRTVVFDLSKGVNEPKSANEPKRPSRADSALKSAARAAAELNALSLSGGGREEPRRMTTEPAEVRGVR